MPKPTTRPPLADGAPPELAAFIDTVERLHAEHTVAPVFAGDQKIYAYGGSGTIVIVSDRLFAGLVELETRAGSLRVEPDEAGRVAARLVDTGASITVASLLAEGTAGLERYYRRRYWTV